MITYK
ncbi:hypothetical protein YPPY46_4526, partial [Yersinia pestis PY-46]